MAEKGLLFIISAPSGAGKTTLYKMLLEHFEDIKPSISCTTREKRDLEIEGKDYSFISDDEFVKMTNEGKFLEWAEVHNHKYGTPKEFIETALDIGEDILFDIDVHGAKSIKQLFPDAVLIFILPPSINILQDRLISRMSEVSDDIKVRMENAMNEIVAVKEFDYLIINNYLQKAFDELKSIIISNRLKKQLSAFNLGEYLNSE